ncbi:hypothetical protein CEH05_17770 [Halobacillus halophilus]|uniref:Uncharacterized protein n=1 Tax=Halobacillus halophilus (strain ATCC 35676 / DSM 2266 / JCM 20832 / KCTC 3685 / LMG 17431 / NBRC 102448 / NCIMB 2269) TaxID=866895 RepID=I0JS36_HALH3|nr:hypothetical protein [Halobacillus halophilus]ASF40904.1 hypothetical protein CEH05_17770 [Halobacillus halophilus]CCG46957.1 hypothetical protein HBHAL_4619 [Halobacillus halophilus DSM 2266]
MFRYTIVVLAAVLFLSGCGLQVDKYQGQTSRDDVENMGMNEKITTDTQNPRLIKYVGDSWGLKQDRKLIKEAAAEVPGVKVKRVILEASQVWVSVDMKNEDKMSDEEIEEWKSEIKQAVYKAVPRYNIHVKIK